MCGIVGYTGPRSAQDVVIEGLRRLEYRGYDSAGIAVEADGRIEARKKSGKITNLDAELAAHPLPASSASRLVILHDFLRTSMRPSASTAMPAES